MVVDEKVYFNPYFISNQYIWIKHNNAQLNFVLERAYLHCNFPSLLSNITLTGGTFDLFDGQNGLHTDFARQMLQ